MSEKQIAALLDQISELRSANNLLRARAAARSRQGPTARLCFVGCGNIAGCHLEAIHNMRPCPRFRITAVVDPDPSRTAEMAKRIVDCFADMPNYASCLPMQFASLTAALAADTAAAGGLFDAVDIMVLHML